MPWDCSAEQSRPEPESACSVNLLLQNKLNNIDAGVKHACKKKVPLTAVSRPINYNLEKHSLAA